MPKCQTLSCGNNPGNNNWNIQTPNTAFPEGVGNMQAWKVVDGTCHKSVLSLDSGHYVNRYHNWGAVSYIAFQFCPWKLCYLDQRSVIINMKK